MISHIWESKKQNKQTREKQTIQIDGRGLGDG